VATTLVAMLAVLPACGSEADDAGGETLTKAELVAQGDEICQRARERFVASQPPVPSSPERAAALQRELIEASTDEVSQIRALKAPPDVEPALDRYLKARDRGIVVLRRGLQAAREEDLSAYGAAQRQMAAGQLNRLKLAQAVGFNQCSRPGGSASDE
jgi:hypothetical protein